MGEEKRNHFRIFHSGVSHIRAATENSPNDPLKNIFMCPFPGAIAGGLNYVVVFFA